LKFKKKFNYEIFKTHLKFRFVDSYFLCLIKESKQRKSSQKKPAGRTRRPFPIPIAIGILAGHRAKEINNLLR
jgi:hypothetical protein